MYGYKANGERVGLTRGTDLPFDEKTIGDVARAFAANTLKFVKSEQDNSETVDVPNDYRITFQGGVSLNAGAIRQAIENSSYGGAEGDRERINEDLKKVRTGEINAEFIQSEYGHHYISSAIQVVSILMKAKESGDAPTYLYARAWLNNDEVNVKRICRAAAIETLGVPLKVSAQNRSWDEWLVKFLNLSQAEVEQYEAEREKYRQQESEEAERKKKEELQQEAAIKAEKDAEEARLAEALGLTPNTLAARRAVADLTKNNPRRLGLKDGTRVVVNNRKERVEKAIEDGNTDLQVRYKVRKSENNIIGKEKFYWDYVSEKEYNQAKEKGLKVAMEYFLQGEDKLGFELNKYEYDYAKFLLSQQNKATEEPIEVTGKEFGEFDTSTKEGKKALREEAFNYLVGLAESGDTVFCPAVNAYVGFTKSAAKKYKSLGGNPIKLKLAAMIKEIIKKATLVRKNIESYDVEEQKSGITYDVVRTKANIDGKEYGVRTVLRHLSDGRYQYDLQVKDSFDAILDSIEGSPARLTKSDVASLNNNSISAVDDDNRSNNEEMQAILDGTQENNANGDGESKYVLNLFVEYQDENGNWVELKDEEDEPEIETTQIKDNQAEQEDKSVDNSVNQQEQQDRAFLEKTIAGDFDALSDEFEQQITEIAERYDGKGDEMEALVVQAIDVFAAKLDELSA
ncbi:hypothetical protein [Gallibacterium anatis]|uniref:LPD3 domain-containing protein n=1 Tax=Gallibacterium anatis TaxID=750 RepID=UPI00254E4E3E|nr:hypothetical protein [Gallibacterium anatis]WIM82981.1 hypothetical protein QP019_04850 [Gallibacterium anatis]